MVGISTAEGTLLIVILLPAMSTRNSSMLHYPCKYRYTTVCAVYPFVDILLMLTLVLFVINEHDIIVVKMSRMREQCVPGLCFPPQQNTKA